jgi:hypothetical protein
MTATLDDVAARKKDKPEPTAEQNVYTEVFDAKTLNALKRLGRQLGS